MGMITTIVAVLALAYGILITISSLNAAERFAGKPCSKAVVKSNNGLIVMGGAMMAFAVSYLACQTMYSSCSGGGKDYFWDNSLIFALALIGVAIVCITLSAITENNAKKNKDCPNVSSNMQAIWVPGIIVLIMGLIVGFLHMKYFTGIGAQYL
jgi:hypothetical protein